MKKSQLIFITLAVIAAMLTGCQKTDVTPAYIVINKEDVSLAIDNLELTQFNSNSGLTARNFPYVWVTVDGDKLGIWELPCKVPVLNSGIVSIELQPGIEMNGMSTTCPEYPFVTTYKTSVFLEKGVETEIKPRFQYYKNNLEFPLVENFETAGTVFAPTDTSSPLYVQKITDPSLIYTNPDDPTDINTCSGYIQLKDSTTSFEIASDYIGLPGNGRSVFLELNYKCDHDLYAGLIVRQSTSIPSHESLVVMRSTKGEWKKIYINLTLAVSRNTTATGFKIVFSGATNGGTDIANYYFDNIRVMYIL